MKIFDEYDLKVSKKEWTSLSIVKRTKIKNILSKEYGVDISTLEAFEQEGK
jgi:hypothetical protein